MRIIITDCDHANMDQEDKVFNDANLTYEMYQCKTEEDLIEKCKGGEIFINQYAPFTKKVISALKPEIKQIVRYGVGVNNVDLEAATMLGVQVCNVPDYGMNEVADHAVAMLMSLVRKVCLMDRFTKAGNWDYTKSMPIYRILNNTIGIVGLGRIGKTFAKRMHGFGCEIISCDPRYMIGDKVDGVEIVEFDKLVEKSDMISIHCPLKDETKNLFNLAAFKNMKKTAYIVNTARGGIINEDDLYIALKEGLIAGAGLDVVEEEPMKLGNKLFEFDNFICTPHLAWYSEESAVELKRKVAEEAVRFSNTGKIQYAVNHLG